MPPVLHRNWQGQFLAPAPIYLDSSVTVALITTTDLFHARAVQFTGDHLRSGREMQGSLLTLDETIYRVLRGLIARRERVAARQVNPGMVLKQQPRLLAALRPQVQITVGALLGWMTLTDGAPATPRQLLDSWLDRFNDVSGLHDAWHLSLAQHGGAQSFATADADFQGVVSLPVPMQIVKL